MARLPNDEKLRKQIISERKIRAKRLEQFVHDQGLVSVHHLIQGMNRASYYDMYRKMISGSRNFSPAFLKDLQVKFPRLNMNWLLTGVGESSAGSMRKHGTMVNPEIASLPAKENDSPLVHRYMMPDNSMAPNIMKGDMLVCQDETEAPVYGELSIVKTDVETLVRIVWIDGDSYVLSPYDKSRIPESKIDKNAVTSFRRVTQVIRNL